MSVLIKDKTTGEWEQVAGGVSYSYAPIGAIFPFGGSSAPSGYLMCDGSAVSRTDYSALFAVIGTSFGAGDGSTTFNVPDLREAVPVGTGENGTQTIAEHDVYTLGQFKDDQKQTHMHSISHTHTRGTMEITGNLTNYNRTNAASGYYNADGAFVHTGFKGSYASSPIPSDDINVEGINFIASRTWTGNTSEPSNANSGNDTGRTGTTTHGKQLGVNYIIKAKDVNLSGGGQALADRVEALETTTSGNISGATTNWGTITNATYARSGNVVQLRLTLTGASLTTHSNTTLTVTMPSTVPVPVITVDGVANVWNGSVDEVGHVRMSGGSRNVVIYSSNDSGVDADITGADVWATVTYITK